MRNLLSLCLVLQLAKLSYSFAVIPAKATTTTSSTSTIATSTRLSAASKKFNTGEPVSVVQSSSASKFSGAGPIEVNMNAYNIPLEEIVEQWTAELSPATPLQQEGVYLGAKDKKRLLVDTLKVEVARVPGKGLGLELLELAGGRNGVGITVVSGFVDGGMLAASGILEGDSIAKVAVRKTSQKETNGGSATALEEMQEEFDVATECLDFDKTIEAITSLPAAEADDGSEILSLTIKRLRRKPKITVNLQYPPEQDEPDVSFELFSGENLRRALLVRGTKLNDALSRRFDSGGMGDCGAEGTCATCVVSVVRGDDLLNPMGLTEKQILEKNPRWRMACKTIVGYGMREGALTVRVNPKQW